MEQTKQKTKKGEKMKKLLITGGVLFSVLPAMGATLDIKPIISPEDNGSCSGEDFQGDFTAQNPLQMRAIFVTDTCAAGTYFNVADNAYIDPEDGKIKNASCTTCNSTGHYCPGGSIEIVNGTVSTQGLGTCPAGYTDGADATSINGCSATCSLNDLNYTMDHASSYSLVSGTATYNEDPTLQQFCEKIVAVNGCDAGYTRTSVADIIGDELPTTPGAYTASTQNGSTTWTAILGDLTVGGVAHCKTSVVDSSKVGCFMRATSLNGHAINGDTLEAAQYNDLTACETGCAQLSDQTVGAFFVDQTTADGNRFAKMVGNRYFCVANEVNINWGDNINTTCTYGGGFTAPASEPTADEGYKFVGWKIEIEEQSEQPSEQP